MLPAHGRVVPNGRATHAGCGGLPPGGICLPWVLLSQACGLPTGEFTCTSTPNLKAKSGERDVMDDPPVVIILNYHRVGPIDPSNPLHRLHSVDTDVFLEQLAYLDRRGCIVSLEDIRLSRDLGPLNFALTFDDVPTGALNGIGLLKDRSIPFGLSICGHLASVGWGLRDKVYCILKYLDGPEIERFVRAHLPAAYLQEKAISFYQLTKRPDLDPDFVHENLIEPLFARVADRAEPYLSHAYLSWQDTRDCFVDNPLATLADHSWGHE